MKPLLPNKFEEFLNRFQNFEDGEFRALEIVDATTMKATFAVQDAARDFDWLTIELEFSGVNDARLINDSQLSLVDMSDGISLVADGNKVGFSIGKYNITSINNSICYIMFNNLKYQEGLF